MTVESDQPVLKPHRSLFFTARLMSGLIQCVSSSISSSSPSSIQFYELRLMFLITALRPELRLQLKQVTLKKSDFA